MDSNPRITDLQSVPLSHLGTRPGRTRIPRAGCKGNVAWVDLPPNISRRPHSPDNRQDQTVLGRCHGANDDFALVFPGDRTTRAIQPQQPAGGCFGRRLDHDGAARHLGEVHRGRLQFKRTASAPQQHFPHEPLLLRAEAEGVFGSLGMVQSTASTAPKPWLEFGSLRCGSALRRRVRWTLESGTNPTEERAPLACGGDGAPDSQQPFHRRHPRDARHR